MLRTIGLTALAMIAFAANSVLARLALGSGDIDAFGYTGVRLASGAVALFALSAWIGRRQRASLPRIAGSWAQAGALFGYAAAFSVAYLMLGASSGALILFGSVQLGMMTRAVLSGDRPGPWEWLGLGIAFAALIYLVSPGLAAPDPLGAALMVISGLFWAAYSLLGRGSTSPLADTTGNFLRCLPAAALLALAGLALRHPTPSALLYAIASGAIASGAGYAIWYAALPGLTRARAAIVQLSVPVIAAIGAVAFIGESLSWRLAGTAMAVLGGVAVAILAGDRRKKSGQAALRA
jgi:drug/metabolite transporter (DMT)-like permease